jgi:hypothetical protein
LIVQHCLRDLNHPFDRRTGRSRASAGLDFGIGLSPGSMQAPRAVRRSRCSAAQRTVVTAWRDQDASGVLRDKRPLQCLAQIVSEKKKRNVAPAPICEQQIGQMRA